MRQTNQGIAEARNTGVRLARGTWIALLDHDDRWASTKLDRQLEFAARHDCGIVCSDGTIVRGNERFPFSDWIPPELREQVERSVEPGVDTFGLLIRVNFLCASSVIVHRSALERCGYFDVAAAPADDYDLWLRCMPEARIGFLPERLVEYVIHGSNFSKKTILLREKAIRALLRTMKRNSDDPLRVRQCQEAVRMHCELLFSELLEGRRYAALLSRSLSLSVGGRSVFRLVLPTLWRSVKEARPTQ